MPTTAGEPLLTAVNAMCHAGLTVASVANVPAKSSGQVVSTTPAAGAVVKRGSPVEIAIGATETNRVQVPLVSGSCQGT